MGNVVWTFFLFYFMFMGLVLASWHVSSQRWRHSDMPNHFHVDTQPVAWIYIYLYQMFGKNVYRANIKTFFWRDTTGIANDA